MFWVRKEGTIYTSTCCRCDSFHSCTSYVVFQLKMKVYLPEPEIQCCIVWSMLLLVVRLLPFMVRLSSTTSSSNIIIVEIIINFNLSNIYYAATNSHYRRRSVVPGAHWLAYNENWYHHFFIMVMVMGSWDEDGDGEEITTAAAIRI